jgi:hypothetical protein
LKIKYYIGTENITEFITVTNEGKLVTPIDYALLIFLQIPMQLLGKAITIFFHNLRNSALIATLSAEVLLMHNYRC